MSQYRTLPKINALKYFELFLLKLPLTVSLTMHICLAPSGLRDVLYDNNCSSADNNLPESIQTSSAYSRLP